MSSSGVDDAERLRTEGDEATDRFGAGMSIAHAHYVVRGDSVFVGVADLGAFQGGVWLAIRWVAPVFTGQNIDGEIDEIRVEGYPALRMRDEDDDGLLIALIVEDRFAVLAGSEDRRAERVVRDALDEIDYDRLEDWVDYGRR